jgi:hypothetical protein
MLDNMNNLVAVARDMLFFMKMVCMCGCSNLQCIWFVQGCMKYLGTRDLQELNVSVFLQSVYVSAVSAFEDSICNSCCGI